MILVKTYLARGKVALFVDDWDGGIAWSKKALGLREGLLARAGGLERPADVQGTYARLYAQLATAYRYKGDAAEEDHWASRASAELDALVAQAEAAAASGIGPSPTSSS